MAVCGVSFWFGNSISNLQGLAMKRFSVSFALLLVVSLAPRADASVITIDDFAPGPIQGVRSQSGNVLYVPPNEVALLTVQPFPGFPESVITWTFSPALTTAEPFNGIRATGFLDSSGSGQIFSRVNGVERTLDLVANQSGDFEFLWTAGSIGGPGAPVTSIEFGLRQLVASQSSTFFIQNVEFFQGVPEPATWALIGLAVAGGGGASWRRRRRVEVG